MQHADYFKNTFLPDVVNLNQSRLDKLETRVDSVYAALAGDSTWQPVAGIECNEGHGG